MKNTACFFVKVISGSFALVEETIKQLFDEIDKKHNIEYFDLWLQSVQYDENDKTVSNYSDVHAEPDDYYLILEDMVINLSEKCSNCKITGWFKTDAGEWESAEASFTIDQGNLIWEDDDDNEDEKVTKGIIELLASGLSIEYISSATSIPEETIRRIAEAGSAENEE